MMFCSLFGLSKQAYYKSRITHRRRHCQEQQAKAAVLQLRRQMPRLGTRKLHGLLNETFQSSGIKIGRDKLFALLRREGLLIVKRKKYTTTTNSRHWMRRYPNLVKALVAKRPEQLWVADITYVDTLDGTRYLHLVTDAYSKRIMGFELCDNLEAASTLKALQMAITQRRYPRRTLIHHSDRGLQYCSKTYVDCLRENKIHISMTESGSPYDNAIAERVNGILKEEFGLGETLEDERQAQQQTRQSIATYNQMRPHQSCHYRTPEQMHKQQTIQIKTWKKKTSEVRSTPEVY